VSPRSTSDPLPFKPSSAEALTLHIHRFAKEVRGFVAAFVAEVNLAWVVGLETCIGCSEVFPKFKPPRGLA
jgi:hypothetical protein